MEGCIDFAHVDLDRILLPEGHLQVDGVTKEGRLVVNGSDVIIIVEPHGDHTLVWQDRKEEEEEYYAVKRKRSSKGK